MEHRTGRIFLAMLLIVVGLFFSVVSFLPGLFRAEDWWPSFILLPGLAMLAASLIGGVSRSKGLAAMVIPGCVVSTLGFILLFGNVTGHWEAWAYAWTLIPTSVGLGLLLAARFGVGDPGGGAAGKWLFGGGLTCFAVLGLLFEGLIFRGWIGRWWPVFLVLAGAVVLMAERTHRRS